MERIIIIGCGASGKSTLANRLGVIIGLPVVHLDRIFWLPGNWNHLDRAEFDRLLEMELDKPRWILDGNYDRTLPIRLEKCDTVIWLDYNRYICLFQWVKRVISNWGKARGDMAPGCKEWFDPEFACWIWKFNKSNRKRYQELLSKQNEKEVYILKNRRQLKKFLRNMKSPCH